ncbi:MAG: fasciclin domain-containing protein [Thermostichales cyanobacterium BF4_bins_65]
MIRSSIAVALAAVMLGSGAAYAGYNKATSASAEAPSATIVEMAMQKDSFETLVAALKAADLVETLSGEGPFTVFAPTDEAFAALPEGTLEKLLQPENKDTLVKILTYHVVPGKVLSSAITPGEATTVQGSPIELAVEGETVKVNQAQVIAADVEGSNGVIHVIDQVILPPDVTL